MAKEFNLQLGDVVRVLYGRDAGKIGILERIMSDKNQVIVSGMNVIRSYTTQKKEGMHSTEVRNASAPIHVTNIAPLDPVIKQPTRIKRRYSMTGECVRISKLSGCAMPDLPVPKTQQRQSREETTEQKRLTLDTQTFRALADLDEKIRRL
jgi:large subunit ribosomal protein L24